MMKRMRFSGLVFCASAVMLAAGLSLETTAEAGTFQASDAAEASAIRSKIRAAQFLSKATFGPTQADIDTLGVRIGQIGYRDACEEWIDNQMSMNVGQSPLHPNGQTQEGLARELVARNGHALDAQNGSALANYRYEAWWHIALTSEDQLRQRLAWALSQIFVIGDTGMNFNNRNIYNIRQTNPTRRTIPLWLGMSNYYDMLTSHVFGTYRDLLGDVTYHPVMGVWLSSAGNQKALKQNGEVVRFPDENYAREIQQLFSVGLYQLHLDGRPQKDANGDLIPTYRNEGITEMARVFTGLHFADGNPNDNDFNTQNGRRNWGEPMQINGNRHDNNRNYNEQANPPQSKTIFKDTAFAQTINLPGNYNSLNNANKNRAAKADIDAALDIIADHPNVAPFISRLLIQRLVKSNPSRAYIRRVTSKWNSSGGNLGEVAKAILLDPEVLRGQRSIRRRNPDNTYRVEVVSRGTEYTRLREPVVRATAFVRAMEPTASERPGTNNQAPFTESDYFIMPQLRDDFGQFPYRSPTVFNFYLPDYQSPDLVDYVPSRRNPLGALFTPEFEIINAVSAVRTNDRFKFWCRARWTQFNINHGQATGDNARPDARRVVRLTFDLDDELAMASDDSTPGHDYDNPAHNDGKMKNLLEQFDLLLCNGSMYESTKRLIYESLATTPGENGGQGNVPNALRKGANRVENMLLAILNSPDCAVEE